MRRLPVCRLHTAVLWIWALSSGTRAPHWVASVRDSVAGVGVVVAGGVYVVYTGQGRQAAWLGPLLACVATGVAIAVDEKQEVHEVELVTVGAACCAMSLAGFGLHALYGPDKRALHGSVFLFPVILYVS